MANRRRARGRFSSLFEDLHWADPTTLEFLYVLVERINGMAALAIVTARPHFAVPWDRWHVTGHELSRLPRGGGPRPREHVAGAGGLPEGRGSTRWWGGPTASRSSSRS